MASIIQGEEKVVDIEEEVRWDEDGGCLFVFVFVLFSFLWVSLWMFFLFFLFFLFFFKL